jgi:hypothetical protein
MSRLDELRDVFKSVDENKRKIVEPLIDEAVFLENQMQALKAYKFIKVHPQNPELQKVTAAGKQYREYLQTYTNIIDKLCRIYSNEETEEESPLRAFLKELQKK